MKLEKSVKFATASGVDLVVDWFAPHTGGSDIMESVIWTHDAGAEFPAGGQIWFTDRDAVETDMKWLSALKEAKSRPDSTFVWTKIRRREYARL